MSIYRLKAIVVLAVMLLALLGAGGFGCGQNSDPIPFRLGVNSWVGYDPFVVAKESGYLERQGWHLVESASNVDSARRLRNGTLDAATLTLGEALNLIDEGAEISIVLALSVSKGADVVLARPGWDKESLRSATSNIAFENTTLSKLVLTRFIEGLELDKDSLQTQIVTAENHEKAFLSEEVDLLLTFEPIASRIEKLGAKRVFDSSQMDAEIFDVLVVNNDALQNDFERVSQLIFCWELGLRKLFIRDAETLRWLSNGVELDVGEYESILDKLRFLKLSDSVSLLKEDDSVLADVAKRIGEAIDPGDGNWTPELLASSIDPDPLLHAVRQKVSMVSRD